MNDVTDATNPYASSNEADALLAERIEKEAQLRRRMWWLLAATYVLIPIVHTGYYLELWYAGTYGNSPQSIVDLVRWVALSTQIIVSGLGSFFVVVVLRHGTWPQRLLAALAGYYHFGVAWSYVLRMLRRIPRVF